jgi:hypothetical protein
MLLVLDVVFCKCVDSACSGAHGLQSDISPVFLFGAQERELMEQSWQSRSAAPEQPHNGRLAEAARPEEARS